MRAFFEVEPPAGQPVQVVDMPPEGGLPSSKWTVRQTETAWEVSVEQVHLELARQGISRAFATAYLIPASENSFMVSALFPKPWSDFARTLVDEQFLTYIAPACPTFATAFQQGQQFAKGLLQQADPFAAFVNPPPEGWLAAISFELPTPSIQTPPDVTDLDTRRAAWGATEFAYEMTAELQGLADKLRVLSPPAMMMNLAEIVSIFSKLGYGAPSAPPPTRHISLEDILDFIGEIAERVKPVLDVASFVFQFL